MLILATSLTTLSIEEFHNRTDTNVHTTYTVSNAWQCIPRPSYLCDLTCVLEEWGNVTHYYGFPAPYFTSFLLFISFIGLIKLLKTSSSVKGQIISKCLFVVFNFFQKPNENTLHSSKNEFICSFFGRILGLTISFRN